MAPEFAADLLSVENYHSRQIQESVGKLTTPPSQLCETRLPFTDLWQEIIPARHQQLCVATLHSLLNSSAIVSSETSQYLMMEMAYLLSITGTVKFTKQVMTRIADCTIYANNALLPLVINPYGNSMLNLLAAHGQIQQYQREIKQLQEIKEQAVSAKQKNNKLLGELKQERNGLRRQLEETLKCNTQLAAELQDRKCNISASEVEQLRQDNVKLEKNLRHTQDKIAAITAAQNAALKELTTENSTLRNTLASLQEAHATVLERLRTTESASINIPVECMLRSMAGKRIVIVGGDIVHEQFAKYPKLFRLVEANSVSFTREALISTDLVVLMTSFMPHKLLYKVASICTSNNVPMLREPGRNFDQVCANIFKRITSD